MLYRPSSRRLVVRLRRVPRRSEVDNIKRARGTQDDMDMRSETTRLELHMYLFYGICQPTRKIIYFS
jgi:hypothetical protein